MLSYNPITEETGECLVTGRGAIAIRLALDAISVHSGKVLLPANICYAAVLPVLYAGLEPMFCDVDAISGNVTFDTVSASLYEDVVAAIIPHMYGNPVADLPSIARLLRGNGITLIEDCASLMAKDGNRFIPGTIGDFVVYSTGYSKTIDIGIGGLLFSKNHSLKAQEVTEALFPPFRQEYLEVWSAFSKAYRRLRNDGQTTEEAKRIYAQLPNKFRDSFGFRMDERCKKRVLDAINELDQVIVERRRRYQLYWDRLEPTGLQLYTFEPMAIPWRFNMFVGEEREDFIRYALDVGLPVSDWYPKVTPVFGCNQSFLGVEAHERRIVNFPLTVQDETIEEICTRIQKYYRGA